MMVYMVLLQFEGVWNPFDVVQLYLNMWQVIIYVDNDISALQDLDSNLFNFYFVIILPRVYSKNLKTSKS